MISKVLLLPLVVVAGFLGGCAALEISANADTQGAEVTARLDYAKAWDEMGNMLAQWRGERGLPDFTLSHADAPDFKGVR